MTFDAESATWNDGGVPIPELSFTTALTSWQFAPASTVLVCVTAALYAAGARRTSIGRASRTSFLIGCGTWFVAANGFTAVYGEVLFWVRALQFVLLVPLTGFLLAAGRPVSVLASQRWARRPLVRWGRRPIARLLLSPPATAALMLVTPWLLFLTPWYRATVSDSVVDDLTGVLLVFVGAVYFYARLQVDPVPRHRHAGLSLLIATAETLGDGVLGVILWQGGVLGEVVRQATQRDWGPSARTDQTIGAGVLWVLGDAVGLPFLMYLFSRWRTDDERTADRTDHDSAPAGPESPVTERPWFLDDPDLTDRFRHR